MLTKLSLCEYGDTVALYMVHSDHNGKYCGLVIKVTQTSGEVSSLQSGCLDYTEGLLIQESEPACISGYLAIIRRSMTPTDIVCVCV